jgi:hypothetical protein
MLAPEVYAFAAEFDLDTGELLGHIILQKTVTKHLAMQLQSCNISYQLESKTKA